jgi:hypothetical protein
MASFLAKLLLLGGLCILLYWAVQTYQTEFIMAGGLIAAGVILAVLVKAYRRYGSLFFKGVTYTMKGDDIINYANKYFKDGVIYPVGAYWFKHGRDEAVKIIPNVLAHLDHIRNAAFDMKGEGFTPLEYSRLPPAVKKALLPDLLGFYGKGWRYRLDLETSIHYSHEFNMVIWSFEALGQAPILDNWHKRRKEICAIMGEEVRYDISSDGINVHVFPMGLEQWDSPYDEELFGFDEDGDPNGPWQWGVTFLPDDDDYETWACEKNTFTPEEVETEYLPEVLPFVERQWTAEHGGHLAKGYIFFGTNVQSGKMYWKKIDKLSHHLVMGISGYGKSVFLNQVLQGVRYNAELFERVYLVDMKGGVELIEYHGESVFQVLYRYDDLCDVVAEIVALMDARLEEMRNRKSRKFSGKRILFVVDEYAQIQLHRVSDKEAKAKHENLLAGLNRLSMLGRAVGVTLWAQLQKGTTDVMDSSFRTNLQAQVCFRVPNRLTAASMFGSADELPEDPTKLDRGQFIYFDDATGETVCLQAHIRQE